MIVSGTRTTAHWYTTVRSYCVCTSRCCIKKEEFFLCVISFLYIYRKTRREMILSAFFSFFVLSFLGCGVLISLQRQK
jgi:hypothetical protein